MTDDLSQRVARVSSAACTLPAHVDRDGLGLCNVRQDDLRAILAALREREAECQAALERAHSAEARSGRNKARAELAEAKLSAMVEAARPFVEAIAELDSESPGLPDHTWPYASDDGFTLGDLRTLKAASDNATDNGGEQT